MMCCIVVGVDDDFVFGEFGVFFGVVCDEGFCGVDVVGDVGEVEVGCFEYGIDYVFVYLCL